MPSHFYGWSFLSRRQGRHLLSKIIFLSGHLGNFRGDVTGLAEVDFWHPNVPERNTQAGVISAVPAGACEGK